MRGRALLVVVAAVLGILTGVAAAFVVPEMIGERPGGDVGNEPGPADDPLGLGIPLENLDCSGQAVLILTSGDTLPALSPAVANHADLPLRYLRTAESCDTQWIDVRDPTPEYVVYAGPYDNRSEPCQLRLTPAHKRHMVLRVAEDVRMFVKCLCEVPRTQFPDLYPGMEENASTSIYVWQMQNILARIDLDTRRDEPGATDATFRADDMTASYDDTTQARIRQLREDADLPADDRVDSDTWKALTDIGCPHFNY